MAAGECSHPVLNAGSLNSRLFVPFLLDAARIPSISEFAGLKFDRRVRGAYWRDAVFGNRFGRFGSYSGRGGGFGRFGSCSDRRRLEATVYRSILIGGWQRRRNYNTRGWCALRRGDTKIRRRSCDSCRLLLAMRSWIAYLAFKHTLP